MKILDQAPPNRQQSASLFSRFISSPEKAIMKSASELLTNNLGKMLDDRFVLLKNVTLRNTRLLIPMILVGPTGILVIFPSNASGIFRAKESTWEQLGKKGQNYKPAKPNLLLVVKNMATCISDQLSDNQIEITNIDPLIFFADPGLHLDAIRPDVKMIMPDTLERFVAGILKSETQLDRPVVYKIIRALENPGNGNSLPVREVSDEFSFKESRDHNSPHRTARLNLPRNEPTLARKVPFTRPQWSLLMVLIFLNIIFLTTLVMVYLIGG